MWGGVDGRMWGIVGARVYEGMCGVRLGCHGVMHAPPHFLLHAGYHAWHRRGMRILAPGAAGDGGAGELVKSRRPCSLTCASRVRISSSSRGQAMSAVATMAGLHPLLAAGWLHEVPRRHRSTRGRDTRREARAARVGGASRQATQAREARATQAREARAARVGAAKCGAAASQHALYEP